MSSRGKYRSYTVKLKLEVVNFALNHSKAEASRKYGVHRKLVQTWCHQQSELSTISSSRKWLPGGGMKTKTVTLTKSCIAGYWNSVKAVTELRQTTEERGTSSSR